MVSRGAYVPLAWAVAAVGCNAIIGLESGELDPGQAASSTTSAVSSSSAGGGSSSTTGPASSSAGGGAEGGAGGVAGAAASGSGGAGGRMSVVATAVVASDADDAMWLDSVVPPSDERLKYAPADLNDYVGNDNETESAGIRFSLDVPKGALIESATLTLRFTYGDYGPADEVRVRVWDSSSVPAFDDAHTEVPAMHDPAGLAPPDLTGWSLPAMLPATSSREVAPLVQHIVDRADWAPGSHIGFYLTLVVPAGLHFVGFADFSHPSEPPASLTVTFVP